MPEEALDDDVARSLSALADGEADELTAEAREAVLRDLAARPQAAVRLAAEVRMRQAVSRNMAAMAPAPSEMFRRRIEDIARTADRPEFVPVQRAAGGRPWVMWPAAAAAVIFLAVGLWMGREMPVGKSGGAGPVPASVVADVTHIHVDCSRAPGQHTADFPRELGDLRDSLKKYLGQPVPYPDLSSIGYEYIGAGPCAKPLDHMVHLLYRAKGGPVTDTVSLFVESGGASAPQGKLQEGKVYWAAGKDAAHPMLVWRRDDMTFYLVGDADEPVLLAAQVMGVGPPL